MEVAVERGRRHGELAPVEIVTGGERDVPPGGDAHVAGEVERVTQGIRITHRLLVECSAGVFTHRDAVADGETPGNV